MATRPLTLAEKLTKFVERWQDYQSTEMAGAQSFLHHLLECYDALDYEPGTLFEQHPVKITQPTQPGMFEAAGAVTKTTERMDMYIPRICVWEMKGPDKDLNNRDYYNQVLRYWSLTRPRYMVLCNFHEFRIYDTDREGGQLEPVHILKLAELPDNPEALNFLRGEETYFARKSEQVTRDAARHIGQAVRELILASDNPQRDRERITKFALECVFAMFGEDTGIIPGKLFEKAMKLAQSTGDLSPVYTLFDDFGREHEYDRSTPIAPYINGPLFDREHPKLPVNREILARIYEAADFDWSFVRPEVFGSIFEQAFLPHERHELGAHFTAEDDIMKVVGPTVVRPWRERIAAAKTHKDCEQLIERMRNYHVLDPACGSGNFLYVVYREMKRLALALRNRHQELYKHKVSKRKADMIPPPPGPYFSVAQLHGIDKDELAVQLSRVTLWIGQHLSSRESDTGEVTLPLTDLSDNIIKADALFTDWFRPPDDGISELAIVGNPPFMGRHKMRLGMGDEYVDELHTTIPSNRGGDYVTYWYTKALSNLMRNERAGFVSTNSIAQNESRECSLDLIDAKGGTIIEAWKSYTWPGEANVHVSIVSWVMSSFQGTKYLDGEVVDHISPNLSVLDLSGTQRITANRSLCFRGVEPGNKEFLISRTVRDNLIAKDPRSIEVIKPFMMGSDLLRSPRQVSERYIIDFNRLPLEDASSYPAVFAYVREHVYPARTSEFERKTAKDRKTWWQHERPRVELRTSVEDREKFTVVPVVSTNLIVTILKNDFLPGNKLNVIIMDDMYCFGVIQSAVHEYWAWARGATLKADLSYTSTTIFETFPFPLTDSRDPFETMESGQDARSTKDREDKGSGYKGGGYEGGAGILPAKEGLKTYRHRLPHWRLPGSVYFVTWRVHPDRGALPDAARHVVADALHHFDAERYELLAYVVMDDHVHVLLSPMGKHELTDIVHSWKSFAANEINRLSGNTGPVWLDEYFDRIMRDEDEVLEKAQYILNNPLKRWPEIASYEHLWCKWISSEGGDKGGGDKGGAGILPASSEDGGLEARPTGSKAIRLEARPTGSKAIRLEARPTDQDESGGRDAAATGDESRAGTPAPLIQKYNPRVVPDTPEAARVSQVAEELYTKRQAACLALNLGLTKLYNYIKGKSPLTNLTTEHQELIVELQGLHEQLNNAVCACYGWPEDTWRDENEVLSRLLRLNLALTEG